MNCPSRTDDELEWTPGWNQNPPTLAADLTTCQDLNGLVNARELRSGGQYGSHPFKGSLDEEDRAGPLKDPDGPSLMVLRGWAWWVLSVFATSLVISKMSAHFTRSKGAFVNTAQPSVEITKRSSCTSGGVHQDEYSIPWHVGALFIILFISTTGCAFPMLVMRFPCLRIPSWFLFSARHFGTGVLIATAFVHLLPTAFISLGDPCLSSFWTTKYQAMPGAIALAAIFALTLIEMVFSPGRSICGGGHGDIEIQPRPQERREDCTPVAPTSPNSSNSRAMSRPQPVIISGNSNLRDFGPLHGRATSMSRTLERMTEQSEEVEQTEMNTQARPAKIESEYALDGSNSDRSDSVLSPEQARKKAVLQCVLLELGILFHSVFIGMSLSVTVGTNFYTLLIAISFHQLFEGLALGARIAALDWSPGAIQPWLMAFSYGCTTPLGQAIGLATHSLYSPDSEVGLLMVGIMNAISSGLLVFASLVELLSEDFLSDESWRVLRGNRRVWACILVFVGAFGMSFVGAFA